MCTCMYICMYVYVCIYMTCVDREGLIPVELRVAVEDVVLEGSYVTSARIVYHITLHYIILIIRVYHGIVSYRLEH